MFSCSGQLLKCCIVRQVNGIAQYQVTILGLSVLVNSTCNQLSANFNLLFWLDANCMLVVVKNEGKILSIAFCLCLSRKLQYIGIILFMGYTVTLRANAKHNCMSLKTVLCTSYVKTQRHSKKGFGYF